jgi:hypothetical protein
MRGQLERNGSMFSYVSIEAINSDSRTQRLSESSFSPKGRWNSLIEI